MLDHSLQNWFLPIVYYNLKNHQSTFLQKVLQRIILRTFVLRDSSGSSLSHIEFHISTKRTATAEYVNELMLVPDFCPITFSFHVVIFFRSKEGPLHITLPVEGCSTLTSNFQWVYTTVHICNSLQLRMQHFCLHWQHINFKMKFHIVRCCVFVFPVHILFSCLHTASVEWQCKCIGRWQST